MASVEDWKIEKEKIQQLKIIAAYLKDIRDELHIRNFGTQNKEDDGNCTTILLDFGPRLREIMDSRHMTVTDLARKIHVTQSTISGYICDYHYPPSNRLRDICEALNCSADYLLGLKEG